MIGLIIVVVVIAVIGMMVIGTYNRLVALRQNTNEAFADIDVQLKQRQDLIPNLVETVKGYASHERGTLDGESLMTFGLSMLIAGYRTSTMFLADTAMVLLTEPGEYARLRDNRDLLPGAVEELLRYIPVMNGVVVLQAVEDIELHGRTIRAGDAVLPVIASANRDENVFSDAARLDVCRADNPHLTFGRGAHNCIGSHLARAQMTVCLEALFDRLPNLRLAEGHHPLWEDDSPSKSPITLPVTW